MKELLLENVGSVSTLFIFILWIIIRLTPTKKDDQVIRIVFNLFAFIFPDRKKGGGKHY